MIRTDFPGGWAGDKVNGFTSDGLTPDQIEMQTFLLKLLNYRKSSKAIDKGITKHFAPDNGVYILFRILEDEVVITLLNKNEEPISLDLERYAEIGLDGKTLTNIVSGESITWKDSLELTEKGITILTTK